jgi:BlaI family transcriptional regulator, penicillinase repressor
VTSPEERGLSRRERQIMDFLFRCGTGSVADVLEGIPEPPSYSAVRAMLRVLEQKGHIVHEEVGRAYIYRPTVPRETARRSALKHLLRTFFDGSTEQAVAALLDLSGRKLTDTDLDRLTDQVKRAKREGR